MREFQEFKDSELQLAQLAKELKEGTFVYHMNKAIAAHERGDAKKKQMHLDNAKTARYSMKSTEIAKHKDLLDKYSQMREEVGLPEESELSEGTLMVSRHRSYARPGQGPEAHPITKDHGKASDGSRVYSVKQPNGFHGVLAVKGDTVVGSSHKNLSKDEAHKMGDHYVKHGTVGIGVGNHWSVGSGIHGKVVKEESELDEARSPQQSMDFKRMMAGAMSRDEYNKKWKKGKCAPKTASIYHNPIKVVGEEALDEAGAYQEEIEKILASDEFAALDEESKNAILARLESISESAAHDSEAHYEYSNNKKSSCNENRAAISFRAFLAKLEEAKKYVEEDEEEEDEERTDKKSDRRVRKYPVKIHDGDDDGKNLGEEFELDEGQTVKTKTGVIHKGSYGSEYEGNEKKKEAPAVKRGRGRPKKGSDESGNAKKYTFHDLLNRLSR